MRVQRERRRGSFMVLSVDAFEGGEGCREYQQ
jgi:hypothetical protein